MENKEFLRKLGYKIRILRDKKHLSQEGLAELSNTERGYISNIENGKGNPSVIYLKQIAEALDVELVELFNFTI